MTPSEFSSPQGQTLAVPGHLEGTVAWGESTWMSAPLPRDREARTAGAPFCWLCVLIKLLTSAEIYGAVFK